jgi:hypothetical protein
VSTVKEDAPARYRRSISYPYHPMRLRNFVQSQARKAVVARNWARLAYSKKSGFHPPSDACKVLFAPAGVGREGVFFPRSLPCPGPVVQSKGFLFRLLTAVLRHARHAALQRMASDSIRPGTNESSHGPSAGRSFL